MFTSAVSKKTRPRVLVADDNDEQRALLKTFVRDISADFDFVADGQEAVEAYERARAEHRPYSLLILDVVMPRLSGLGAAEAVRNTFNDKTTPIRFLTAETNLTSVTQTRAQFAEGEIWLKSRHEEPSIFNDATQWSKLDVATLKENILEELRRASATQNEPES